MVKILVVDDKPSIRKMLKTNLEIEGYDVVTAKSGEEALEVIGGEIDLIISDLKMNEMSGIDFLKVIRSKDLNTPFILMTAYAKVNDAIEAMKLGIAEFIEKPFEIDFLLYKINQILKLSQFKTDNKIKSFLNKFNEEVDIIGESLSFKKTINMVEKVSQTDSSILFFGESGTGKEVFAKYLHYKSSRAKYPLVAINCAAIPSELMEAELFGYEKGAFTGANTTKIGLFEVAKNGTIFLDEIGELPYTMQSKLLRVLQEKEFLRVGGIKPIKTNVRLISATNQDLNVLIDNKQFRQDLYFRISVIPIKIPSLSDRKEDIILLVDYFIEKFSKEFNKPIMTVSDEAKDVLLNYKYRGNIRELKNVIERAVILSENNTITTDVLGIEVKKDLNIEKVEEVETFEDNTPLQVITEKAIRRAESKHIMKILNSVKWNRTNASKILRISYKTLLTKIKDYDLKP
jgi:two-component system response regulator AtoC